MISDAVMAYSIDGATDGAIQDILCRHTQNSTCGAFWDFRPPHFEGVWRVPIYIGPPEWNVGESRGALLWHPVTAAARADRLSEKNFQRFEV